MSLNDALKEQFTFVWEVENFPISAWRRGDPIESIEFEAKPLNNTKWILKLYPRGTVDSAFISCFLIRQGEPHHDPREIDITYTLTIKAKDLFWQFSRTVRKETFAVGTKSGFSRFFSRKVLEDERTAYLPNDTLTVSCYMSRIYYNEAIAFGLEPPKPVLTLRDQWPVDEDYHRWQDTWSPYWSSCLTKIRNCRFSFMWIINKVSTLPPFEKTRITQYMRRGKLISLTLNLTDHGEYSCIEIETDSYDPFLLSCKIAVSNVQSCFQDSAEDEHLFNGGHVGSEVWKFKPFLKRNNIISGNYICSGSDQLVLLCEGSISSLNDSVYYVADTLSVSKKVCGENSTKIVDKELLAVYEANFFTDVSLLSSDRTFRAHKLIICCHSNVFRAMFENDKGNLDEVDIGDVHTNILDKMLKFMYSGALEDLSLNHLIDLFKAAVKYEVAVLKKHCLAKLKSNLCLSNVCELLALAHLVQDKDLIRSVENFIFVYLNIILYSSEWHEFRQSNPEAASKTLYSLKQYPNTWQWLLRRASAI